MDRKPVSFDTNLNNKLHCQTFCHIAYAPAEGFLQADLPLPVLVSTKDNSYPPFEAEVFDLIKFPWLYTPDFWSHLSHGMCGAELIGHLKLENKFKDADLCVYFYRKVMQG
jgi:hypothetical protein